MKSYAPNHYERYIKVYNMLTITAGILKCLEEKRFKSCYQSLEVPVCDNYSELVLGASSQAWMRVCAPGFSR